MTQPAAGVRVKKTTFTEILPQEGTPTPDSARASRFYNRPWEEVVTDPALDWSEHKMCVYRAGEKWDRGASPVDNEFNASFTEEDLRERFGGGKLLLWLKGAPKKHNLVGKWQVELEGDPVIRGVPRNGHAADGGSTSVAIEAMRMYANPQFMQMQMEVMRNATLAAIEVVKAQMPQTQDPLQTLRNAKEILGVGGPSADSTLIAHITLLKELGLIGSPEKKGITEVLETLNAFKTAGLIPAAVQKADIGSMFAANLPMIVDRFVNGLKEFRLQAEAQERTVRLQRGEMRPSDPNVITLPPQETPSAQAAATSQAASPAATATNPPEVTVTPEVAQAIIAQSHLHRLVQGIKNPKSTGQDMYDYLRNAWPEILDELVKFSKEQLLAFFKSRDAQLQNFGSDMLTQVAEEPRLPGIIEEFLKIARENAELEKASTPQSGVV